MSAKVRSVSLDRGSMEAAVERFNDLKIDHIAFKFPLQINKKGRLYSSAAPLKSFELAPADQFGLTYLAYRLDMERIDLEVALQADLNDFVRIVNERATELGMDDREYTVALANGRFRALMDIYTPLTAQHVAELIEAVGVADRATVWLNEEQMSVWIKTETKQTGTVGVAIRNGFCGTVAFNFVGYFMVGALEIDFPIRGSARHQNRLTEALDDLGELLEVVGELNVIGQLEAIKPAEYMPLLDTLRKTPNSEILLEQVRTTDNLFEALGTIGEASLIRGFGSSANRFVAAILAKVPAASAVFS